MTQGAVAGCDLTPAVSTQVVARLAHARYPDPSGPSLQSSLRAVEASLGLGGSREESLVQLQQSIAPAFVPPKAVARAMQRIAANQVCCRVVHACERFPRCSGGGW